MTVCGSPFPARAVLAPKPAGSVSPCAADGISMTSPVVASAAAGDLFSAADEREMDRLKRRATYGDGIGRRRDRLAASRAFTTECLQKELGR